MNKENKTKIKQAEKAGTKIKHVSENANKPPILSAPERSPLVLKVVSLK